MEAIMKFVSKKCMYRPIGLALTCLTLSSSAMHNGDVKPQISWLGSLGQWACRIMTPSSGSVLSRKQWAIGGGAVGVGLAGIFLWNKRTAQPKPYSPITEEKVDIKGAFIPIFNLNLDLASHCRIWARIQNKEKRTQFEQTFQKAVDGKLTKGSDVWKRFMEVKEKAYTNEAMFKIMRDSAGKAEPIIREIRINETDGTWLALDITADKGRVTKISGRSMMKVGPNTFAQEPLGCYEGTQLQQFNEEYNRNNAAIKKHFLSVWGPQ
jgi:hypothetical protein